MLRHFGGGFMPWRHLDISSLHWVDSARFGCHCKRYNQESATERLREGDAWNPSTVLAVNPSVSTMSNGAVADSAGDSGQQTPEETRGSRDTFVFGPFQEWLKHHCSLSKKDHALTAEDLKVMEGTYWLARIVFFRTLGFVYFTAFLIAHMQGPGLFGQDGLFRLEDTPPCKSSGQDSRELWTRFAAEPSLFHFFSCTDASLLFITSSGLVLSAVLILTGGVTVPVLLWLWLSYMTIQTAGQRFYTFTWDTLLLEVGFWAMPLTLVCFLPPFLPLTSAPSPSKTTPDGPGARPSTLKSATMSQSAGGGGVSGAQLDPGHPKEGADGRGSTSAAAELSSTDGVRENPSGPESDSSSSGKRSTLRGQQMLRWPRAALQLLLRCCHSLVSPGAPFLPPTWPTPWISVWGYRWLLFRLMLGAGLIKLRADTAWTNLTAMQWHYETQPLPNPVAWFAHMLPMSVHKFEVLMNHFAELVLPFAVLSPWRQLRLFSGCFQLLFQVAIIITGNLAFINWLTIVFIVFLFDDRFLMWLFPTSTLKKLRPLLQGCPGNWSFPSSDSVTKDTSTSVSKSESEKSPREPQASSEQRPLLRNDVKLRETSEAEEAHCPPSSSSATTAAVSRALPWRLLTGPKWTGRALRRMLATWGCWRIPLFLFIAAVLVTSDGILLLLLGKAATAPSLSTTLVWESAGLLLLILTSVVALGGLAGAAGVPWSLLGAAVSAFSPRFTAENQHPLTNLASLERSETAENASLPTHPQDSERRGTVLRRPRQTEEDVGGHEGGVVESRRQSKSVVDADEGRDEAKLLWKRTQDVGALAFEVLVAGVVLANLLFMHFHLGPTFAGLDLLTGLLCVLLFAFAHHHCSNSFLVLRVMTEVGLLIVLVWRSIPVVENLLSPHQIMNDTYDSFRLVNSYGLFGFMTKQREELVIQGTYEPDPPSAPANPAWQTYEFYCKPGDIDRRPCFVSPYYYRLDWLMWFAAFNADLQAPYWLLRLVKKMLANDPKTSALLAHNPFRGKRPPTFIRILRYDYHFAYKGKEQDMYEQGKWWQRKYLSEFLPPVSAALFRKI
ncbi:putative rhoptry protein [Toxoplasma gondii p89]|uniref:Putative rhoptry protein n=1 Tax=Toxoplasma gondii p89 TaxID=943119 RepID=A0A086KY86_TOXGO|nr:putative rhoptry protein [Toxoplasma gondii p89]